MCLGLSSLYMPHCLCQTPTSSSYSFSQSCFEKKRKKTLMAALMPDSIPQFIQMVQATPFASSVAIGGVSLSLFLLLKASTSTRKKGYCKLPRVPAVPGVPLLGNLLQLKEKKPHKTFARWADTYGPIYSIRTGASTVIVLNSTDVAKEAMVTRHSSISTRKLNNALTILTNDKCMVAMSDYNDFHKTVKRHILTNVLGPSAQKRHRCHRDVMLENILSRVHAHATYFSQSEALNFRDIFESELFGLALKEALGKDIESVYVEELGKTFTREDVFQVLVHEQMEGAIEVDWRDFFPYFKWIPNNSMETKIKGMAFRRNTLMKSIVKQHKSQIASGQELNSCYLNFLLSEAKTLTEDEIATLVWETIIEASDTNMVVTEWAMYELAKNPHQQDCLHREIRDVCGSEKLMEEDINKLPYLSAVFHETLRRHSPVPVIPLRYAHEDTQIAGYHIPAGSEIAINIYGCNMDKKQWESPEEWKPERFLDGKYDPMDLYKTMAFGGGKRVCAGSLQAMLIACTAIGKLVQEFEWRLNVGEYDSVDTHGLTGRKQDPLHLLVKPRN